MNAISLDTEAMAAVHARAFAGEQRPWSATEIDTLCQTAAVFQHRDGNDLLGFALVRVMGPEAELLTICVDPQRQGCGIGRKLLQQVIQYCANQRVQEIFIEVSARNHAAQHLYLTSGWIKIGQRKGYYAHPSGGTSDALVLKRLVSAETYPTG